jgi:hypothetical protein
MERSGSVRSAMFLPTAAVVLVCVCGVPIHAAPEANEGRLAKDRLEALKKRLPDLLVDSINKSDRWAMKYEATVQSLRLIGPAEAKLTIRLEALSSERTGTLEKVPASDEVLVIFLSYYDGNWTTKRFEATWVDSDPVVVAGGIGGGPGAGGGRISPRSSMLRNNRGARFLLAAIDEAGDQQK